MSFSEEVVSTGGGAPGARLSAEDFGLHFESRTQPTLGNGTASLVRSSAMAYRLDLTLSPVPESSDETLDLETYPGRLFGVRGGAVAWRNHSLRLADKVPRPIAYPEAPHHLLVCHPSLSSSSRHRCYPSCYFASGRQHIKR